MKKEKSLETKIKDFLKTQKIYYFKTNGSIYGTVGLPDLVICINGKFIGIELKAKNNKASLQQLKNGIKILENNGIFAVIDDYDCFMELFQDITMNRTEIRNSYKLEEIKNEYELLKNKKIKKIMKDEVL